MSSDRSFGVVWLTKRHVRLAPSVSRTSPPSHPAHHCSKLFVCFALSASFLQFLDVSRAYPHAEVLRDDFCVETVPEMVFPEDTCLLARRGWYGMRDAGQAFEFAVRDHFLDPDFKQGMFSTCVFAYRSKFLLYFVHGDDYVGLGVRGDLEGYKAKLSERFIVKDRGFLGADGLHEIRILNRVITYHLANPGCPEMLTYEADQRHADLLIGCIWTQCVEQGQGNSLGPISFPGSASTGRTILGREATSRVPQQLHEMLVLGSRST